VKALTFSAHPQEVDMTQASQSRTAKQDPGSTQRDHRGRSFTNSKAGTLRNLLVAAAMTLTAADAVAGPLPYGTSQQTAKLPSGTSLEIFTYRPDGCETSSMLLVFHGLHRNVAGYRDHARALADANCMLVVAPLFDKERFPGWRYQLGGIVERREVKDQRQWTGNLVLELVEWVKRKEGRCLEYSMIGHSAGGQFLSRLAAFVPTEAHRIVIANPSTYVAPTLRVGAPFGLGQVYDGKTAQAELRRYLAQPVTIFLGGDDVGDQDLNETAAAMAQGATRLERGRNIYRQANTLAAAQNWAFNWRLVELPGVGHSARKMFSSRQAQDALK
jgi:poly(3-hydroxybutyrate) depolymerase